MKRYLRQLLVNIFLRSSSENSSCNHSLSSCHCRKYFLSQEYIKRADQASSIYMVYLVYSIHDYIPWRYCKMSWHWSSTNRYIREFHDHNIYLFFEIYFQRRGRIYTKGWYLFSHYSTSRTYPMGSDQWSNNFCYCRGRNWSCSIHPHIEEDMGKSWYRKATFV